MTHPSKKNGVFEVSSQINVVLMQIGGLDWMIDCLNEWFAKSFICSTKKLKMPCFLSATLLCVRAQQQIQWRSQAPAHPGTCPRNFACALAFTHGFKLAPCAKESACDQKRRESSSRNTELNSNKSASWKLEMCVIFATLTWPETQQMRSQRS